MNNIKYNKRSKCCFEIFITTLIIFILSIQTIEAQVFTDQQIGFDREETRQELLNDGVEEKDIHKELTLARETYVNMRVYSQQSSTVTPITSQGCGNIDFVNEFNEWCYKRIERSGIPDFTGVNCNYSLYQDSEIINPSDMSINNWDFNYLNLNEFGENTLRLGDNNPFKWVERIEKEIIVTQANSLINYRYAFKLEEPNNFHSISQQPYFRIFLEDSNGNMINCSLFEATVGLPGINCIDISPNKSVCYLPATVNSLNFLDYVNVGDQVKLVVEVADCGIGGHYGYAYFEAMCTDLDGAIIADSEGSNFCSDNNISFTTTQSSYGGNFPDWKILNGGSVVASGNGESIQHYFSQAGNYTIEATINLPTSDPSCNSQVTYTRDIVVEDCPCECEDCTSFSPVPGERYIVSGWVSEEHDITPKFFKDSFIQLTFDRSGTPNSSAVKFYPSGQIIDGWQRVFGEFTVPNSTYNMSVILGNNGDHSVASYFDDIRIHPYNGNLKSFVYDQETQRLMAELDENNYATYYEYDKEGGLIRVKKETERGVYTIQETRSGNSTLSAQN
ncbi:hypothetical protein SAMN04488096_10439 [Mesonia phycicola]|uniref:PKD domain-containing protein n=1 Tax=Mesonia phycicola TaxID=579105 RepID=A0A1M6DKQ9_9FLAO|nr:hypothetical protein [Mesonia phycicola]SHI73558.1 hypothetical protein SAMN04488096_10439 [Mesonia phycicola]